MKRSLQEVVELVVFGLVALLIGTALLWLVGWLFSLGGALFKAIAGLLWLLLRFIVPIAIVAGLVYFLVKALQGRQSAPVVAPAGGSQAPAAPAATPTVTVTPTPAPPAAEAEPAVSPEQGAIDATEAAADAEDEQPDKDQES